MMKKNLVTHLMVLCVCVCGPKIYGIRKTVMCVLGHQRIERLKIVEKKRNKIEQEVEKTKRKHIHTHAQKE